MLLYIIIVLLGMKILNFPNHCFKIKKKNSFWRNFATKKRKTRRDSSSPGNNKTLFFAALSVRVCLEHIDEEACFCSVYGGYGRNNLTAFFFAPSLTTSLLLANLCCLTKILYSVSSSQSLVSASFYLFNFQKKERKKQCSHVFRSKINKR